MSVWRFTNNSRVIRRVAVENDADITSVDALGAWFEAQWIRTGREPSSLDTQSPRRQRTDLIRYRNGALAPAGGPLRAGNRVELEGAAFELVSSPRQIKLARTLLGFEAAILPVEVLYPYDGALQEMGGSVVDASIRFSAYSADESHEVTGTYEDYQAETDLSNFAAMKINRVLIAGTKSYKITAAEIDVVGGYIRMSVRKSGAGA